MAQSLRLAIADAEREIVSLTTQQVALLANLRRMRRCVVVGGAGTGKTMLAVEKLRQVAAAGGRSLLVWDELKTWASAHAPDCIAGIATPDENIDVFVSSSAIPFNVNIDARTMKILDTEVGVDPALDQSIKVLLQNLPK